MDIFEITLTFPIDGGQSEVCVVLSLSWFCLAEFVNLISSFFENMLIDNIKDFNLENM